jgi:hypothetical protein
LLVESGHQLEGGRTVPFYQFRHLTFQEYLAAVAAVEGHYSEYEQNDTVVTPLATYLTAEEWKEVIPMAGVLARKHAEPLMAALVTEGNKLRRIVDDGSYFPGQSDWLWQAVTPAPIALLVQCLVEEAQAAPETLIDALQLAALFASGARREMNWPELCAGPYGDELLHQAWLLYAPMDWPADTLLLNSCGRFALFRHRAAPRKSLQIEAELQRLLESHVDEEVARGLFICIGYLLGTPDRDGRAPEKAVPASLLEQYLFRENLALAVAAAYALSVNQVTTRGSRWQPSPKALDRLLTMWSGADGDKIAFYASMPLGLQIGSLPRRSWTPVLTEPQMELIRKASADKAEEHESLVLAGLMVAFHAGNVWPEEELAMRLVKVKEQHTIRRYSLGNYIDNALEQMGDAGRKYLESGSRSSSAISEP